MPRGRDARSMWSAKLRPRERLGVFFGRNVFQADNISTFLEQARAALDGAVAAEF